MRSRTPATMIGGPILKLIMDKGPRKGETLEFRPGSAIQIGRVARGNTVAIKDAGISSKHLSIDFRSGKWIISDLGSSNGTLLNDRKLPALKPSDLGNGDFIKIGEVTSIEVVLVSDNEVLMPDAQPSPKMRRNPKRRAAPKDGGSGLCPASVSEVESKIVVLQEENEVKNNGNESNLGLRLGGEQREKVEGVAGKGTRRDVPKNTRGLKETSLEIKLEEKQEELLNPRTDSVKSEVNLNSGSLLTRLPEDLTIRRDEPEELENLAPVAGKKPPRPVRRKKNLQDETREPVQIPVSEIEVPVETMPVQVPLFEVEKPLKNELPEPIELPVPEVEKAVVESNLAPETHKEAANLSAVDEACEKPGNEPDLEKMTLGEWFDYLEVHLPKQIYDETEEMISNMRERAKQFHQFMLEQGKEKDKVPMC